MHAHLFRAIEANARVTRFRDKSYYLIAFQDALSMGFNTLLCFFIFEYFGLYYWHFHFDLFVF